MSNFEHFKKDFPSNEKFYSFLTDKIFEHVLNVWNKFKMKTMKDYCCLYLKYVF